MQISSFRRTLPTAASCGLALLSLGLGACAASDEQVREDVLIEAVVPAATISHDVFFTFREPTDASIDGLIAACEKLRILPGVMHLTAGRRDPAQTRDVNEQTFHVALHVEFEDQAAYDAYSPHPVHQALVKEFIPLTSAVVVYDALIGDM
ncbi:Stress responsive A/B Barrel Domain protein [Planctomycetes bacterium Poly30]|uniref:Stress responsive A/B Barrel Domain protein n=1 Tax=Saltatorellus ferox TaxID=2528018 RepID=A0A518EPZ3_9BACT|nr:Stress responsive A/B Barrel Domain protein [Planctomycetes bacterium Poly30]